MALTLTQDDLNAIADAVWNEAYSQHTTAGTFGKLMDILRKANTAIDGQVSAASSPTALQFSTTLTDPTSTHKHQLLVFTSGTLEGTSRPIDTYSQTNGLITLQEPLSATPIAGDEFTILTQHVHPTTEIALAVRSIGVGIRAAQADDGTISLYDGRTYDGTAHDKISFVTSKDYQSATSIEFAIYNRNDQTTEIQAIAATAPSASLIEVNGFTLTPGGGVSYAGDPLAYQARYSLTANWAGDLETIATGDLWIFAQP